MMVWFHSHILLVAIATMMALTVSLAIIWAYELVTGWSGWYRSWAGKSVFVAMAVLAIAFAGTKPTNAPPTNVGGNAPMSMPRRILHAIQEVISSNDVVNGYRVVEGAENGGVVPMPSGAVTNELLRRRGGYDYAFRVEPEGWRFPYRDGFLDGVTVLACGEVRPDIGALYFPVPITNGVSLLPEPRWGLLPHAEPQSRREASVFWHGMTASNSLVLTWENALVGRDLNSPTNLQLELFHDGSFTWRTDDASQFYLPVFPFDWDGDGLENSVDPEPLVANPVDAHGTNAEWYRIVCSNVFDVVDGVVSFRPEVNSNAYYFVEITATEGPAPVFVDADRDSHLGSPTVVALGSETNRVPLLIGVAYTVTSTVPISVSTPDAQYAVVTTNSANDYLVKWPLSFDFVEGSSGGYTVNVVPYDPGGTFTWNSNVPGGGSGGGAMLMSAVPPTSCACWSGSGSSVSFNCVSNCSCKGGCRASGTYSSEAAEFAVTGGVCRCSAPDAEPIPPSPSPLIGGVYISFSQSAVIFEDSYTNAPNDVVARQSTTTRLTISASGGMFGGRFTLNSQNLTRLIRADGPGPVVITQGKTLGPYETFEETFVCKGIQASESEDDVYVGGVFTDGLTGLSTEPSDAMTVVRVELVADKTASANPCPNRHTFGVFEMVRLKHFPEDLDVCWEMSGGGTTSTSEQGFVGKNWGGAAWMLRCPLYAKAVGLTAKCNDVEWVFDIDVLEPSGLRTVRPTQFTAFQFGMSAVEMKVPLYLQPETVNFQEISIQEIPVEDVAPMNEGCYTNLPIYYQTHTISAGAGRWTTPGTNNYFGIDTVRSIPTPDHNPNPGWQRMYLPWGWNKKYEYMKNDGIQFLDYDGHEVGGPCYKEIPTRYDSFEEVYIDASVGVNRYGWECLRTVYGIYFLNGEVIDEW